MIVAGRQAPVLLVVVALSCAAEAQDGRVNTLKEMSSRFDECYLATVRELGLADVDITVWVSFKRDGQMIGPPRLAYESKGVTDEQDLHARTVVKEMLQRCTPMPFTETMAHAVAGRMFRMRFDMRRMKSI